MSNLATEILLACRLEGVRGAEGLARETLNLASGVLDAAPASSRDYLDLAGPGGRLASARAGGRAGELIARAAVAHALTALATAAVPPLVAARALLALAGLMRLVAAGGDGETLRAVLGTDLSARVCGLVVSGALPPEPGAALRAGRDRRGELLASLPEPVADEIREALEACSSGSRPRTGDALSAAAAALEAVPPPPEPVARGELLAHLRPALGARERKALCLPALGARERKALCLLVQSEAPVQAGTGRSCLDHRAAGPLRRALAPLGWTVETSRSGGAAKGYRLKPMPARQPAR